MRVLHVEDEHIHHVAIKQMLVDLYGDSLAVDWSQTYEDGMDALQHNDYDLVILDYVLGESTATDILRDIDAPNLSMPFIVISGFDEHKFDVAALRLGADDYLIKGHFNPNELRRAIEYAAYRKEKMYSLNKMAFYDNLTNLPNRHYLTEHTEKSVFVSTRVGRFVGVYYIDVDDFKVINDIFGHQAGDHVLKVLGERFDNILRRTDTAVRLGGDEFIVVSPGITRIEHVQDLRRKLHDGLTQPIQFGETTLSIGCSIGTAMIPGDADELADAIDIADKAMYAAKHDRKLA